MKCRVRDTITVAEGVVPRVGTWVEMILCQSLDWRQIVVPRVGTWVEMMEFDYKASYAHVVPRVGTWVEMACLWAF